MNIPPNNSTQRGQAFVIDGSINCSFRVGNANKKYFDLFDDIGGPRLCTSGGVSLETQGHHKKVLTFFAIDSFASNTVQ